MAHDVRDQIIDFVRHWSDKTQIGAGRFIGWLSVTASKFYDWRQRYGRANQHNTWVPRDFWLQDWEKQAILEFYRNHPLEGYRRLTFLMLDADIVAVSPSSTWRGLSQAGWLRKWNAAPAKKGTGFEQPPEPHQHWHIDVSYLNLSGTFYYLCSGLDGYSRSIVHWDLRPSMTEAEIEITLEAAREQYPEARPRSISDNGPLPGVHSDRGDDPRADLALLPAVERETGALAPITEGRMPAAADAGRCPAPDPEVCGVLQPGAVAQRDRIRDAGRHAGGPAGADPCGAGSQAGGGPAPASAGGMNDRVTMALPGETEAGSAGKQPCRGIAWRAHRDDDRGRAGAPPEKKAHRIDRPQCLENPRPEGAEYSLVENADSPVPAEPEQNCYAAQRASGFRVRPVVRRVDWGTYPTVH